MAEIKEEKNEREAVAHAKFARFGARKVAQVLDQVRGKSVLRAEQMLPMIPRRATELVAKTLKSAAANLKVKRAKKGVQVDSASMYIKAAWVGQGPMGQLKRVMPAPQGRAMIFKRKVCHLTMIVSDVPQSGTVPSSKSQGRDERN